jgi:cytochrome c-type biogenesis protein CcmH
MNVIFWGAMLLMLLFAISALIYPLLGIRRVRTVASRDSNLGLYDEKLKELDMDFADGRIDQAHYTAARNELDLELLEDIPVESRDTTQQLGLRKRKHPALALMIAVVVPAFATLLYTQIGMHAASNADAPQAAQEISPPSVEAMVLKLEAYLQDNPGTLAEWSMLGRAYKHLGRYQDAAQALGRAIGLQPGAELMLEKAEALALMHGQKFNDEARNLVLTAQRLEPDNINVLWFAGVAEFQAGNYRASIDHLSRLAGVAQGNAEVNRSIRFYIDGARRALAAQGESLASTDELLANASAAQNSDVQIPATSARVANATGRGPELMVTVSVTDAVRNRFKPDDIVFVYAKAQQGPPMPLAVQRITLAELPATITLDDSMAMMQGMNLSAFVKVTVAARISRSGSAMAQSGDYIGEFAIDDVNSANSIAITIEHIVP